MMTISLIVTVSWNKDKLVFTVYFIFLCFFYSLPILFFRDHSGELFQRFPRSQRDDDDLFDRDGIDGLLGIKLS